MADALPWFKFYSTKYLSSMGANSLTPIQEQMFLRLIVFSSLSRPRGSFPDDLYAIREMVRWDSMANAIAGLMARLYGKNGWLYGKPDSQLDDNVFFDLVRPVLAKFRHDPENHCYWNEIVVNQLEPKENGHSEAGKKGAAARWGNHTKQDSPANGKANSPAIVEVRSVDKSMCVGPADPEAKILALVQAHPKGKKYDTFEEVPYIVQQAIVEAITRESKKQSLTDDAAYQYLLERTRLYESYVSLWPKSEQSKCYRLEDWFNRKGYRDEPETWSRDVKQPERSKPSAAEQRQNTIIENARIAREMFLGRVRGQVSSGVPRDAGDLPADHHARGTKPVAGPVVEVSSDRGD